MSRRPTAEEIRLACKLVGPSFSEIETIKEQLATARVSELDGGLILEFDTFVGTPLATSRRVLGEGSLRDVDDMPIIFTLLQRDGYVWRLDIARADSSPIKGQMNFDAVVALGFGKACLWRWTSDSPSL